MKARKSSNPIVAASGAPECPFRGFHSYDIDHQNSFKGRDQETMDLAQRILGNRLTVLTGGSGDGKTSLVHAGLAPLLFSEGYEVAAAEPGGHAPVRAVAGAALDTLLPSGEDNLAIIEWLDSEVAGSTLREKREVLLEERRAGTRRSPWQVRRPLDLFRGGPLWIWLINEHCRLSVVDNAMNAIALAAGSDAGLPGWPGVDAKLGAVRRFFKYVGERLGGERFDRDEQPSAMLDTALDKLGAAIVQRCQRPGFELILIVDQFEEIFVQFRGGSGAGASEPWRHKQALLDLILEISECREWPVRLVLSMRKEHYADLQAAFPDQELLAANTYHLAPLRKDQAWSALTQLSPNSSDDVVLARWNRFLREAIEVLASEREGKWVDATELSSFGSWIWQKPMPADPEQAVRTALVSQIESILEMDATSPFVTTPSRRQELLDVLFTLIISAESGEGRRVSLPEPALRAPAWRSPSLRKGALAYLLSRRLIRSETRDRHVYYEIVHERTIPVLEQLRAKWERDEPMISELGRVLGSLRERCLSNVYTPPELSHYEFQVLSENRERLDFNDFAAARLMDGFLASDEWRGDGKDKRLCERLLKQLVESAEPRPKGPTVGGLDRTVRQAMADGDLASPALAATLAPLIAGTDEKAKARWLLASSLLFTKLPREWLEDWSATAMGRARS